MRRKRPGARKSVQDPTAPKYSIAIASDLSGVPQQQLRRMEEGGLLAPHRSEGKTRRYSDNDLQQIGAIADLADAGVNAAGIRQVLDLREKIRALKAENARLRRQLARVRAPGLSPEGNASEA